MIFSSSLAQSPYSGKSVITVGKSKKVLSSFTSELERRGFKATYSDDYNDPESVLNKHDAKDFDVLAVGRGLSSVNKLLLKTMFKKENPNIAFVEGLAPITELLVDQVKLACKLSALGSMNVSFDNDSLTIRDFNGGYIDVHHYHLNWFYKRKVEVLFSGGKDAGLIVLPFKKRRGQHFITITIDGLVTNVLKVSYQN